MTKKELVEKLSEYPDDSLINIQSDDFNCNFSVDRIDFSDIVEMPELYPGKPLGHVISISLSKWAKLVRE